MYRFRLYRFPNEGGYNGPPADNNPSSAGDLTLNGVLFDPGDTVVATTSSGFATYVACSCADPSSIKVDGELVPIESVGSGLGFIYPSLIPHEGIHGGLAPSYGVNVDAGSHTIEFKLDPGFEGQFFTHFPGQPWTGPCVNMWGFAFGSGWSETEGFAIRKAPRENESDRNSRKKCVCPPQCMGDANHQGTLVKSIGALLTYVSDLFDQLPASLGYGWSAPFYARVEEDEEDEDDVLYFHHGNGQFDQFILESGTYVPAHPDNYIRAVKNGDGTFTLTFQDSSVAEFGTDGKITAQVDRNGNTTTYTYDSGVLAEITDWRGRTLYFTHQMDGQPTSIREENATTGRETRFEYYTSGDHEGKLRYLYNAEDERTEFLYGEDGRLFQIKDPRGEVAAEYTYFADGPNEGRVQTETFYGEELLTSDYEFAEDGSGIRTLTVEDLTELSTPAVRAHTYELNQRQNVVKYTDPLENVYLFSYEAGDPYLLTRTIAPNLAETRYVYNAEGMLTKLTDAQGNVTRYEYADDLGETVSNPLHRNLLRKIYRPEVTVPGEASPVEYDPTELLYDSNGNLVEIVDALGNSTYFGVGSDGLVTSITDRRGYETVFEYNADLSETDRKNLRRITTPGDGTDNPSRTIEFFYDSLYDRLVTVMDPLGNQWSTEYDLVDRPTLVTDARAKEVAFSYLNGLLDEIELPANQGSSSTTRKTNFSYDDSGRLSEILSDINSTTQQLRVRYEYDGFSNLRKLVRLMNATEKFTAYDYDELDRTISVQDPMHTSGNRRETVIEHAPFCTQFEVTTARGIQRMHRFDTLCRLTQVKASVETQDFEYDQLGRLVRVNQSIDARYGEAGSNYAGRLYASGASARSFEYDPLDRLVKQTFEDETFLLFDYDEESNLVQLTDTDGNVTEYTYYKDNRLKEVILKREGEDDRVFTYRYDECGRLKTLEYPESTGITAYFGQTIASTWHHGWNANGQLTYLEYRNASGRVHKFEYSYDDSGNRIQLTDTPLDLAAQIVWDYSYDWLNRLESVTRSMPEASPAVDDVVTVYSYDESDNRTEFTYTEGSNPSIETTYSYNAADEIQERMIASVVVETFTHDKDGNMLTRVLDTGGGLSTTTYSWDHFDRLVTFRQTNPTRRQRYRYDTGNIRTSKSEIDGARTTFKYGGMAVSNEARTPGSGGGSATATAWFGGHQLLGFERGGSFYYLLADGLSSVRTIVTAAGGVAASYNSDEFGNPIQATETSTSSPARYVGGLGVRDEVAESGLLYMRHRWMEPTIGRFTQRDPVGFSSGLNLYVYATNQPVDFVDPDGLEWELPSLGQVLKALSDGAAGAAQVGGIFLTATGAGMQAGGGGLTLTVAGAPEGGALYLSGTAVAGAGVSLTAAGIGLKKFNENADWDFEMDLDLSRMFGTGRSGTVPTTQVYTGTAPCGGPRNYVGITNNLVRRANQWLGKYKITPVSPTKFSLI